MTEKAKPAQGSESPSMFDAIKRIKYKEYMGNVVKNGGEPVDFDSWRRIGEPLSKSNIHTDNDTYVA